jgi:AGZA family xanthine/uracil permease-like MFS transporter
MDINGAVIGGDPDTAFVKVAAATALVAGVLSILMGLVANFPLALAAGLGLNAFVAYTIVPQMTWRTRWGWWSSRDWSSSCWCSPASARRCSMRCLPS